MLTCKHATKLMSQSQDRPLEFKERLSLKFHLMMCAGCNNYNKQMAFIHKACRHVGGDESK